jgi:hypothetical protein
MKNPRRKALRLLMPEYIKTQLLERVLIGVWAAGYTDREIAAWVDAAIPMIDWAPVQLRAQRFQMLERCRIGPDGLDKRIIASRKSARTFAFATIGCSTVAAGLALQFSWGALLSELTAIPFAFALGFAALGLNENWRSRTSSFWASAMRDGLSRAAALRSGGTDRRTIALALADVNCTPWLQSLGSKPRDRLSLFDAKCQSLIPE